MNNERAAQSGKLIIPNNGKLILTGEVFDDHGNHHFNAYVDTGCNFNIALTQELADAVCAPVTGKEINISTGAGTGSTIGHERIVNLKFGNLTIKNYKIIAIPGKRNLIGVNFFQDVGIIIIADFHKGKTQGGIITSDRKVASIFGKTAHCFFSHGLDISNSDKPCPVCGQKGE